MRILITGGSSGLGAEVLRKLLKDSDAEIWCTRHRQQIPISDPRVNAIDLDLGSDFSQALVDLPFDLVIHFAGVTHASDEAEYWRVNAEGTARLAQFVNKSGCRRFVYISTRCATELSGAYGESKLAAEKALQRLEWRSLLIIRPAEVYGQSGKEGIDRMLAFARKWRIVPALFGHRGLLFAPLHIDDFCQFAADLIKEENEDVRIEHACGPEDLSGVALASRISRRYWAVPLPLWWPALSLCLRVLKAIGVEVVKADQLKRLVAAKTATAKTQMKGQQTFRRFLLDSGA